jgi:NAD-dependent deacetylase
MGSRWTTDERTFVLVLTGAGISAESGIPTFRGTGGLWEGNRVEDVASPEGFRNDVIKVWRFYSERRTQTEGCSPNACHRALVELERKLGERMLLVTQNIDGLHQKAGSENVIELHGNLFKTRCSRCDREPFEDHDLYLGDRAPACGRCHAKGEFSPLRPHIVWFGERIDPAYLARIEHFIELGAKERLVFLAVGTSGRVQPASQLVEAVRGKGGETWLVDAERPINRDAFENVITGPSGSELPKLFA